jgi:hypothetical protein
VNKKKCVATVYKRSGGKWKAFRAMNCSVGKGSTPTPSGTYHMGQKFRWIRMVTEGVTTYEQYTIRFLGQYYLHSPCYSAPRKSRQKAHTYYTLGRHVTHGCIRFAVMDAKWIYENCKSGTKVTIYKSSKSGPLGKPKKVKYVKKHGRAWDPTDPDRRNPVFRMHKPEFTFDKAESVLYGRKYDLKDGVKVMNPNANQNITGKMKITKVTRNGKSIKTRNFSTKNLGEYKVTYYVKDKYCIKNNGKGTSKVFTFQVIDKTSLTGASDKVLQQAGVLNLLQGLKAKSLSKDLTKTIKVSVLTPEGEKQALTTAQAKAYEFTQDTEDRVYQVTYSVTNPYPRKAVTRTIKVTVKAAAEPEPQPEPEQKGKIPQSVSDSAASEAKQQTPELGSADSASGLESVDKASGLESVEEENE